ncbi:MAG: CRISPR-associated endonuclease Cas1, partial [Myxococcota bacterium]
PMCLPDELHLLRGRLEERVRKVRRLHPAQDLRMPLYVAEQGARVGIRKNLLVVTARDGAQQHSVRLPHTSQVCLLGNVQVSTQAIRALLARRVPVVFFSAGGWYLGRTLDHDTKNVELRLAQYRSFDDEGFRVRLARGLVRNKILNARTFLRRNASGADQATALKELKGLARKAEHAVRRSSLLGIEGTAARTYFAQLGALLKGNDKLKSLFEFDGRNRRPPRDPINACLSFAYAMLVKDFALALTAVGLDPLLGYYHEPRFGRPSLALDLMEPFRVLIADSAVVSAINNGELSERDFVVSAVGCTMTTAGRRRLLKSYERRMAHEVTHPVFGYRISYRRVIEVQARLLTRLLLGELETYPEFITR